MRESEQAGMSVVDFVQHNERMMRREAEEAKEETKEQEIEGGHNGNKLGKDSLYDIDKNGRNFLQHCSLYGRLDQVSHLPRLDWIRTHVKICVRNIHAYFCIQVLIFDSRVIIVMCIYLSTYSQFSINNVICMASFIGESVG